MIWDLCFAVLGIYYASMGWPFTAQLNDQICKERRSVHFCVNIWGVNCSNQWPYIYISWSFLSFHISINLCFLLAFERFQWKSHDGSPVRLRLLMDEDAIQKLAIGAYRCGFQRSPKAPKSTTTSVEDHPLEFLAIGILWTCWACFSIWFQVKIASTLDFDSFKWIWFKFRSLISSNEMLIDHSESFKMVTNGCFQK